MKLINKETYMSINYLIIISVAWLLLADIGYGLTPEQAKTELKKMNIAYTESEFLYHAKVGDTTAVSLFLDAGMSPNTKDKYGWTVLMYTVWEEEKAILPDSDHQDFIFRTTPFPPEISNRYATIVRLLIQKGADVNVKTSGDITALWISHDNTISQLLKDAGAREKTFNQGRLYRRLSISANVTDIEEIYGLPQAYLTPNPANILQELQDLKYKYTEPSFLKAVKQGDVKAVLLFLTLGMNPNTKDKFGKTALQIAQEKKYPEIVKLLKHSGAKE
jgi:ankyrin repeat protein